MFSQETSVLGWPMPGVLDDRAGKEAGPIRVFVAGFELPFALGGGFQIVEEVSQADVGVVNASSEQISLDHGIPWAVFFQTSRIDKEVAAARRLCGDELVIAPSSDLGVSLRFCNFLRALALEKSQSAPI